MIGYIYIYIYSSNMSRYNDRDDRGFDKIRRNNVTRGRHRFITATWVVCAKPKPGEQVRAFA